MKFFDDDKKRDEFPEKFKFLTDELPTLRKLLQMLWFWFKGHEQLYTFSSKLKKLYNVDSEMIQKLAF